MTVPVRVTGCALVALLTTGCGLCGASGGSSPHAAEVLLTQCRQQLIAQGSLCVAHPCSSEAEIKGRNHVLVMVVTCPFASGMHSSFASVRCYPFVLQSGARVCQTLLPTGKEGGAGVQVDTAYRAKVQRFLQRNPRDQDVQVRRVIRASHGRRGGEIRRCPSTRREGASLGQLPFPHSRQYHIP